MYRLGHTGIALLVLAPLSYVLLEAHKPLLALVIALGIMSIEPLPDADFKLSFLDHRGVSHSLVAAVIIGGILALCGWVVAGQVSTTLPSLFYTISEAATTGATTLDSLTVSGSTGSIASLLRTIADSLARTGDQLQGLSRQTVAGVGFVIGAGGILVHLLGDVITVSGIRPFLPFSEWRLSLSSLRANSTLANPGLFVLGVLAIAVVLSTAVMGAGVAIPADLSPIGVAASQQTQTQNATSANATVEFTNQTSNGSTVTIERATLSEGGFIAIHTSEYAFGPAPADASIIAVSDRLSAGTHRNITIDISNAPPGNYPGLNQSQLNESQPLAAVAYRDSNDNQRFEFVQSFGETDGPYIADGQPVSDTADITIPSAEEERRIASVTFTDQTIRNNTLVVKRARLPNGGFLIALNESYQQTSDPLTSAVGISRYLSPGTHTNITLSVLPTALDQSQVVTVIPAQDTNDNQRYDYVASDGFQDVAYVAPNRSTIVAESAQVRVPSAETTQTTGSPTASSPTPAVQNASGEREAPESDGLLNSPRIVGIAGILAVALAAIIVLRRVT